jgi:hypothetical protein
VTAQLFAQGKQVFSPLTHNELLIELAPQVPKENWMQFDLTILAICAELYVLKLDGWKESKGVQREIAFAKAKNIAIHEIDPPEESNYLSLVRDGALNHVS